LAAKREIMEELLLESVPLFQEPSGLPPSQNRTHRIHLLPDTVPIELRPYNYAHAQNTELERQCAAMLQSGIIRPSSSALLALVLLVKKYDDSWRFCVDYKALNERTGKTNFSLTNASTTFQALMNNMLRRFILVFFDDILVYSHSWSEHLQHVRIILTTLKEHQLFMKRAKCVFGRTEVSYLGHVISTTGVAMDQLKVQAVLDWPVPTTVRVVRVLGAGRLLPLVHP
jgi:hypothetical protein